VKGWRLLLTRTAPDCAALAGVLAGRGIFSSSLPLLEIQPLEETPQQRQLLLDLPGYAAVIVVSKPAARLALQRMQRYWPQPPAGPAWFSVGPATGQLLAERGVAACWSEAGDDSEALLQLPQLQQALQVPHPRVLIMRGEGGREWLAERLQARGVQVDHLPLYRRSLPCHAPGALLARVRGERLNGLQVSSGQALEHLLQLAADDWPELAGLCLFVPSARVAAQARAAGAQQIVDCRGASTAALLAALQDEPAASP
jgi:uroporphyrinogen-III synthase